MPEADVPTPPRALSVLCVEDNPDDVELMALALERADPHRRYELRRVVDAAGFEAALEQPSDVILCDYSLPRFSPYAALEILSRRQDGTPLVVLTRAIGADAAVHLLRCGARDYVTKDRLEALPQVIDRVLEERRRAQEKERVDIELQAAYARLKALSARFVLAQERERSLISRELHDQLGQTLTAMVIHLHAAERAADAREWRNHTRTAAELANGALQQLKTLSFSLRPAQLDLLGIAAAAQTAMLRLAEPAGLQCTFVTRGDEPHPPQPGASVAVRLVQEAVSNTARHAQARRVWVRLRFLPDGRIGVLVLDDGRGFDVAEVLGGGPCERNLGIYGMIERTELAGGRLRLRTRPGRGVAWRAVL